MKQSQLATKTLKEAPKDEQSVNAILLTRAGYIDKLAAGIYTFLPLGFLVLKKIEKIIREEMIKIGGQEILMPALHPKENWLKTGRWETYDPPPFKPKNVQDQEYVLAPTHEEVITPLVKKFASSYKDLPFYVFQIQDKFRNELRAKSGLLRGREFIMKDLYSFHTDQKDLDEYYEKAINAYFKIYEKCGIKEITHLTFAGGSTFSKYSHEFQTLTDAGEDIIYICQKCGMAINKEIKKEVPSCPGCGASGFEEAKAIEVGNIFKLGTKYSEPFDLKYKDKKGEECLIVMGCYGIGLGRLMGTIVEISHDEKGIIWPESVAPFKYHLITVNSQQLTTNKSVERAADELYKKLTDYGEEVLYDDREEVSAGAKFAEADLIGIPYRLVISEKTLEKDSVEIKKRDSAESQLIPLKDFGEN